METISPGDSGRGVCVEWVVGLCVCVGEGVGMCVNYSQLGLLHHGTSIVEELMSSGNSRTMVSLGFRSPRSAVVVMATA